MSQDFGDAWQDTNSSIARPSGYTDAGEARSADRYRGEQETRDSSKHAGGIPVGQMVQQGDPRPGTHRAHSPV